MSHICTYLHTHTQVLSHRKFCFILSDKHFQFFIQWKLKGLQGSVERHSFKKVTTLIFNESPFWIQSLTWTMPYPEINVCHCIHVTVSPFNTRTDSPAAWKHNFNITSPSAMIIQKQPSWLMHQGTTWII